MGDPFSPGAVLVPLLVALTLASACTSPTERPPDPATPGTHFLAGHDATDTVSTTLPTPLVVRIRNAAGATAASVEVHFRALPLRHASGVILPSVGLERRAGYWTDVVLDTTDAEGRASVRVRLGYYVGPAGVIVSVPALGYVDTAYVTIRPGNVRGIEASPFDTTVYAGHSYAVRATAVDIHGNVRADPVSYRVAMGPSTIAGNTVTGTAIGRVTVVASHAQYADTTFLSVVPVGTVAFRTFDPGNGGPTGVAIAQLDGSGFKRLGDGYDNRVTSLYSYPAGQGIAWTPNRDAVIATRSAAMLAIDTATRAERALVTRPGVLLRGARVSKDGTWLYHAVEEPVGSLQPCTIHRVRLDGTGGESLSAPPERSGCDLSPVPAPDGGQLIYLTNRAAPGLFDASIRVMDLATRQDIRTIGFGRYAIWSPSGDRIAYADIGNPNFIRVIRPTGEEITRLGPIIGTVNWLDWSADGAWIVASTNAHQGPTLFNVATGLPLPIGWAASHGDMTFRP